MAVIKELQTEICNPFTIAGVGEWASPNEMYASLLGGFGNRIHLKSDRILCQQSTVDWCSSVYNNHGFTEDNLLKVRIGPKSNRAARECAIGVEED